MSKNTQGSELTEKIKQTLRRLPVDSHGTRVCDGKIMTEDWVADEYVVAICELIASSNKALLQKVREMLVDEDVIKVFLGQVSGYYDPKSPIRNKLRAELRTELAKLGGEI